MVNRALLLLKKRGRHFSTDTAMTCLYDYVILPEIIAVRRWRLRISRHHSTITTTTTIFSGHQLELLCSLCEGVVEFERKKLHRKMETANISPPFNSNNDNNNAPILRTPIRFTLLTLRKRRGVRKKETAAEDGDCEYLTQRQRQQQCTS